MKTANRPQAFMKAMIQLAVLYAMVFTMVATESGQRSVFEMRLVVENPSVETEDMTFTNRMASAAKTVPEVLHVQKVALIDHRGVRSAALQRYPNNTNLYVEITFTDQGRDRLAEVTRRNIGKRLAIIVSGNVIAVPEIAAEITEGKALIAGAFTKQEAKALADTINAAVKMKETRKDQTQ